MKILYINPGRLEAGLDAIIKGPPMALLTIAAMVPEHEATLFDFKVDDYDEKKFRKLLRQHEVVAITSMTPQIYHALEVAQMAKEEHCITIIGGYHPTLDPDFVTSNLYIDFCVRGEGEHTFKELIDFIATKGESMKLSEIKGISYKDAAGKNVYNAERPLEMNLDIFPFPRRELLKGKKYSYLGTRVMLMETSRGCPHRCAFCSIIKMWKDPQGKMVYRKKSIKRVIQEVYSVDFDNWDFIFFNDDNFTIDIKRTEKICDLLIKGKLSRKVWFSCQSRVDTIHNNPKLVPKMREAGFRQIFLGIESVHQKSLDAMGKHTNVPMIRDAVRQCSENGISIFGGMIIGFPGETVQMVRENINFAISLGLDFVQFTPITAFPGTQFFEDMKKAGKVVTLNYKYYDLFHPMMKTDQLSANQMYELVGEAYSKYYLNKGFLEMMFKRAFTDKNYRWFIKIAPKWIKQFVFGGMNMLNSMGMTFELAQQDDGFKILDRGNQISRQTLVQRQKRFNLLRFYIVRLKILHARQLKQRSKMLNVPTAS